MYLEFYGLKEQPFSITPDPRFIYFTGSHAEAMANLHYGIESGKGIIVVTGEVGTGKTTILRWMLHRLERTVLVAYVFNPRLTVPEFYQHITALLGVPTWTNKSDLLLLLGRTLESRHARGLRTVLIVDEAHGLAYDVLEEIRLLANFETSTSKLLQIVLTGQPELRDVLNDANLRQLKQRVALRCKIEALPNVEETENYIRHRLAMAGANRTDLFTPDSLDFIYRCTEGIPRQINNLCDNSLLAGFAAEARPVYRDIVEEVAENFDMLPRTDAGAPPGVSASVQEAPARVLTNAGRAELWSAGAGAGEVSNNTNGADSNGAAVLAASPLVEDLSSALAAQAREHTANEELAKAGQLETAFQNWNTTGGK